MKLFFLVFLGVYAGMHLLVFWAVRPLLPTHPWTLWLAVGWSALMTVSPLLARLGERNDWETFARCAAWIGYLWLGLLFLAWCGSLLLAGWELAVHLAVRLQPQLGGFSIRGPTTALLLVTVSVACALHALYAATDLRRETVRIAVPALPETLNGTRIVQISDVHLGLILRERTLRRILSTVAELRPDLLVATGDLVDAGTGHLEALAPLLAACNPPLGKFAVTGNHEFYSGLKPALTFLQRSGFTVLRNRGVAVRPGLTVVGVDDPTGGPVDEAAVLANIATSDFVLLLKHRPSIDAASLGRFDLQLSGHAHRGQIFPFNLLTALHYPLQDGLYQLDTRSRLYTSRGTGSWGPPMRLGAPPEITLFILERAAP